MKEDVDIRAWQFSTNVKRSALEATGAASLPPIERVRGSETRIRICKACFKLLQFNLECLYNLVLGTSLSFLSFL